MCRWFDSAPGHHIPCAPAPFSGSGAFLQFARNFYNSCLDRPERCRMATVREYFDTDLKSLSVHAEWGLRNSTGENLCSITAKVSQDFDGNAKYWSFFIPLGAPLSCVNSLLAMPETSQCILSSEGDCVYVEVGFADYSERITSATLVFTKRVFFYIDSLLNPEVRRQLTELGRHQGFHVVVRDQEYAAKRSAVEKPLAFISHDSRDKDSLVRELAREMSKLMCPVWYNEYSLKVGDSLRTCSKSPKLMRSLGDEKELPERHQSRTIRSHQASVGKRTQKNQSQASRPVRGVLCGAVPAQERLPVAHAARRVSQMAHGAFVLCDLE